MKDYKLLFASSFMVIAFAGLAAPPAKAPAATSAPAASVNAPEIPQSVFVIPATLGEGRNPFFPPSRANIPVPVNPTNTVGGSGIILNGLTGPPKRTAMINNRTFEQGEEAEIKLPGGAKLRIRCVQIKDDSATIIYNGQRRELHLRFGV